MFFTTFVSDRFNRFDRGMISNTLEFWGVPGFTVDYTKVFELPQPTRTRSKYTLTQENIMRYSNSSQVHLLPISSNINNNSNNSKVVYHAADKSEPYGGDLEMQLQQQQAMAVGGNQAAHPHPLIAQYSQQKTDRTSATTFNRQLTGTVYLKFVTNLAYFFILFLFYYFYFYFILFLIVKYILWLIILKLHMFNYEMNVILQEVSIRRNCVRVRTIPMTHSAAQYNDY